MVNMNQSDRHGPSISPSDALETVYRDLVGSHYGLAEHGPTDPAHTAIWAMRELRGVLDYIQAIRKAQSASSRAEKDR
jgi:hypothetical protein